MPYPYGVNDKVGDKTTTNIDKIIGSKFLHLNENILGHGKVNTLKRIPDKRFLHKRNVQIIYNLIYCINFIKISIASLNEKSVKKMENVVNDEIVRLPSHFNPNLGRGGGILKKIVITPEALMILT